MKSADNGFYREICPKEGEQGVHSVYDIRLDGLPDEKALAKIVEIKAKNCHVWWPYSEKGQKLLHGKNYILGESLPLVCQRQVGSLYSR